MAQHRFRRFGRRFLVGVLVCALVLTVAAVGAGAWLVQRSFPQTQGTVNVPGLGDRVTVQRDRAGVPVITAKTAHDLFLAQGYVHAQDRFWEMDFRRHMTAGRLAELFGPSQVPTDRFLRTLGWHRIAEREVKQLPKQIRSYYEAYAQGVNAYLKQRSGSELSLEYAVLGLQNPGYRPEKWTPADSVAWLKAMAWDLRTNIEDETTRALLANDLSPQEIRELYPAYDFADRPVIVSSSEMTAERPAAPSAPQASAASSMLKAPEATSALKTSPTADGGAASTLARVSAMITSQGEGIGSNSWVVSGQHTETGKPLLANDPHLGAALPSVWTQMQLRCATVSEACPFHVAGFSFSGLPGIIIGHNEHVGWGFTNLTTDVADLYIERVDGDSSWVDGHKQPLTTRKETLRVAGGKDVTFTVRETTHGPIVSGLTGEFTALAKHPRFARDAGPAAEAVAPSAEETAMPGTWEVSLRWTALSPGHTAEAIFHLNRAKNWDEFVTAAEKFDVPAQNLLYADRDGNIGYQAPGALPIRGRGDGWFPQPGWDSSYDWQGFIPFAQLPRSFNPEKGYIVTANAAIVDDSYPHFLSRDWDYGYRAQRIDTQIQSLLARGPVSLSDMQRLQMDQLSPAVTPLKLGFADISTGRPRVDEALELLRDWDGQNRSDSAAAAYANALFTHTLKLMLEHRSSHMSLGDHSRQAQFLTAQLRAPRSHWWHNEAAGIHSQKQLLTRAAINAYDDVAKRLGERPSDWSWGELHAITLRSATFGKSGIAPIEALFNRGPYRVGGGSGVVDATGFDMESGSYETTTVPSMRMVLDLADWNRSTWIHLTGSSGHAFHQNYVDQTADWAAGVQRRWLFDRKAVRSATADTLELVP